MRASEPASARRVDRGSHGGGPWRRRAGHRFPDQLEQCLPLDLEPPVPRPKSAEWIAAYLHARQAPDSRAIEYRHLVADAIHAAPFSKRRVSVPDAAAVIVEYTRSTGDASRTVDLMLTFAEAGTEQAAD